MPETAACRRRPPDTLLGEQTGFILRRDADTVRCPDAAFVCADRLPPARTVTVDDPSGALRRLREGDVLDGGAILLGFRYPIHALFAGVRRE